MHTPLLLLDVDGVLNVVTRLPDHDVWPDWQLGSACADDVAWPIRFSPSVMAQLRSWHEQRRVELQWLTTWGHAANEGLRDLLGLPELQVAGTHDAAGSSSDLPLASLAGASPAAPDDLTGRWWKLDVVRRLRTEQPDRPLVWVDDELRGPRNRYAQWARGADILAVGPEPSSGLTRDHLATIAAVLPER